MRNARLCRCLGALRSTSMSLLSSVGGRSFSFRHTENLETLRCLWGNNALVDHLTCSTATLDIFIASVPSPDLSARIKIAHK